MTNSATTTHPLLAAAEAILPDVIDVRRRLHRHPEVGLQLPRTQALVIESLRAIGLEPRLGESTSSVVAVIEGARPGPTILLRGDMDGLPLTEDTGLEFASEDRGHDARVRARHACRDAPRCGPPARRATRRARRDGSCSCSSRARRATTAPASCSRRVCWRTARTAPAASSGRSRSTSARKYPAGTIALPARAAPGVCGRIRATVRGRGGHASAPHLALDPIPTAAELVLALQAAVTRTVDAFDPAVVTIARISGGTTNNIIPETVEIEGTIRTVSRRRARLMRELVVRRWSSGVARPTATTVDLEIVPRLPGHGLRPGVTAWVRGLAVELAGEARVHDLAHRSWAPRTSRT